MSPLKFAIDCKYILSCLESILEIFHTAGAKLASVAILYNRGLIYVTVK